LAAPLPRRNMLALAAGALAGGALGLTAAPRAIAQTMQAPTPAPAVPAMPAGPFSLPPLGYAYEALEPHIDTMTMTIHHQRHHGAFITALNNAAKTLPDLTPANTDMVLRNLATLPESARGGVRNALGGHWNHGFFWELMMPGGAKDAAGPLKAALDAELGGMQGLRERVNAAGMGRFGSGWAWLVVDKDRKLAVLNTPYQDNPLMDGARGAVIGVDVWEHAYYLKYQNRRADYLTSWWNTVNWDKAGANYARAMSAA
jgi:Fe-Mn family superoxide dismutase